MTHRLLDEMPEGERQDYGDYADDVDFPYIEATAAELARALAASRPAGACFQPGDGTAYRLVFTPLWTMGVAPGRVVAGQRWAGRPVEGLGQDYRFGHVLISWVDHRSYPLGLVGRGHLAANYVHEHWCGGQSYGSALTLALLFREVSRRMTPTA